MPELVVFRLVASIAAFGDIAVGERRGVWSWPSHSAVTGLLASALGIARADPGHEELAAGFDLAIRTDAPGTPLADFQTAQAPPQRRGRRFATRREEVADEDDLGTVISRRDYLSDVRFTLLLWPTDKPSHPSQALVDALNRPRFAPFAGRRSCPLSAPMAARTVTAETIIEAFAAYDAMTASHRAFLAERGLIDRPFPDIIVDAALAPRIGVGPFQSRDEIRRDRLVSRARWQFEPRTERIYHQSRELGARP